MNNEIVIIKNRRNLPRKIKTGKVYQLTRPDGFTVFLDGDKELDNIRLTAPPAVVIMAVTIRRAQQIGRNYARKYAPELLKKFQVKSLKKIS